MESVAAKPTTSGLQGFRRLDAPMLRSWALAGGLVLYLGLSGGGYDSVVRSQVGTVLWWTVLIGAAWGLLPIGRLSRAGWAALALFGGFVAWTALASSWSLSSERSLQELSRVAAYLGIVLLALVIQCDRERALRHTVNAVSSAVVTIVGLALISRLAPNAFPAAHTTGAFLAGAQSRLSWPLNYWNGLGALVALGLPLLLASAGSARTLYAQAGATAAIPPVALCGYLTFSRGGALAAALALIAYLALAPERWAKLATMLGAAAGSAVLILAAGHRHAIEQGLSTPAPGVEGRQLMVTIALVCVAVGLLQTGIGLAARHGTLPRWLRLSRRQAQAGLAAGVAVALVAALAAGAPTRISRAWQQFENPLASPGASGSIGRFASSAGEGRYQYWKVGMHLTASQGHLLGGSGPGTFQLLWLPHATVPGYVTNAHSLYVETLAEVGVMGLALLAGFFVLVLAAAVRLVVGSEHEARARAAGAAAALLAFLFSAVVDWTWQLPVLPAAFLLLAGAVLAPAPRAALVRAHATRPPGGRPSPGRGRWALRLGLVVLALACLVAIAVPLGTASAVRQSQAAANAGNLTLALRDARSAVRVEPGAASAQLQLALVLELRHDLPGALTAARRGTQDEPQGWSAWLVLARLQAESGHVPAAIGAYRRARSLNPRSPLFAR